MRRSRLRFRRPTVGRDEHVQRALRGLHRAVRGGAALITALLLGLIWLYRLTLAGLLGGQCRFYPSCSHYAEEAVRTHGAWRGTWLTLHRLGRCHPLARGGYEPVPARRRA